MHRGWRASAVAAIALLSAPAVAQAGTYDVVSCGAPGANGVNRAWQLYPGFDENTFDMKSSCPQLAGFSEPRPGVRAGFFTGVTFGIKAPAGAILDRMVIWRHGYRFSNEQGPWSVAGYRGDASVIGGPLLGESCHVPADMPEPKYCTFGAAGMTAPGARVERDLETNEIFYSVACADPAGCDTANLDGFPYAGMTISGSIVTVRDEGQPAVTAGGRLTEPGWHVDDAPLIFGASDPVGVQAVRVLVDGAEVHAVRPPCDFTRVAPCGQVPDRAVQLGSAVPDGGHTLSVEATDTAGNVARVDRSVTVDRNPPALEFVPGTGRRRIVVAAPDAGTGTTAGTIEVRRRRAGAFRPLPARLRGGRLVARLRRGSRHRVTIRASATDAVGHRAEVVGAPARLRAGFGPRLRRSARGGLERRTVVRGRLRKPGGRPLPGRTITVMQKVRADGTVPELAGSAVTGRNGRFRVRVPAGPSRVLTVLSPGTGGLQADRRKLNLRLPWSSSLRIAPRFLAPGGRMRLSGRLRLRGFTLPQSGKRVELQAFDRGRWRVFATTRAFGRRAKWRASYRFGTSAGSYRIRVRIPYEGTVPLDRGYSRPKTVTVG